MNNKTKKYIWISVCVILGLLTVLGIIKALFVSIDVDESYAVAQAYRLVTGDKLLFDMWEPHQFSAFLPAFFLYPFIKITGGSAHCVIYLRIVGTIIHFAIGAFLYAIASKQINSKAAFIIFIIHMNFLSKWICLPEFELMHYWAMILIFLLFAFAKENGKVILYLLAGISFGASVLCYPTMVPVFFVFLISLAVTNKGKGTLSFTMGTALVAAITVVSIIISVPVKDLPLFISYVLMDSSHTSGMKYKIDTYPLEILEHLKGIAVILAIALAVTLIVFIVKKVLKKKSDIYSFILYTLFTASVLISFQTLYGYLFLNGNQFYLQDRFFVYVLLISVIAIKEFREYRFEFLCGILPSILTVPLVFLITNMDMNSLYSKLFPAVIAGLFVIGKKYLTKEKETEGKIYSSVFALSMLLCFFACRLVLLRVNGCAPVTMRADLKKVENGPAAGIYILKDQADAWNSSFEVMKETIGGKNVLYIGQEQLFYVTFCKKVNTPSVQGTTVFNEMYDKYYDVFPDKYPEIIVKDASFGANAAYFNSYENKYIERWISENHETETLVNNGYYELLSLKKK